MKKVEGNACPAIVFSEDGDDGVTVTGCAVGGPESSGSAAELYAEYLSLGGQ